MLGTWKAGGSCTAATALSTRPRESYSLAKTWEWPLLGAAGQPLQPNKKYSIRIRAQGADGSWGGWSRTLVASTTEHTVATIATIARSVKRPLLKLCEQLTDDSEAPINRQLLEQTFLMLGVHPLLIDDVLVSHVTWDTHDYFVHVMMRGLALVLGSSFAWPC